MGRETSTSRRMRADRNMTGRRNRRYFDREKNVRESTEIRKQIL